MSFIDLKTLAIPICIVRSIINLPLIRTMTIILLLFFKTDNAWLKFFSEILSLRRGNMDIGRIDERVSRRSTKPMVRRRSGVSGFHKRSANSEEIAFSSHLTQLFVTFAPLKRVSQKLSFLLIQNWCAGATKMRLSWV